MYVPCVLNMNESKKSAEVDGLVGSGIVLAVGCVVAAGMIKDGSDCVANSFDSLLGWK